MTIPVKLTFFIVFLTSIYHYWAGENDKGIRSMCCKSCNKEAIGKIKDELVKEENILKNDLRGACLTFDENKISSLTKEIYTDDLIAKSLTTFLDDKDKVKRYFELETYNKILKCINNIYTRDTYITIKDVTIEDMPYKIVFLSDNLIENNANATKIKNALGRKGIKHYCFDHFKTEISYESLMKELDSLRSQLKKK